MAQGRTARRRGASLAPPGHKPPGWLNRLTFRGFWLLFGALLRLWFRLRIENRPKLKGGYVVVPNHASLLDPLLVGSSSLRRVTFMMTALIYRSPWTGWFYRWNRAIPVAVRGANREALRAARALLQQGGVLGVFPEGGLSRDGGLMLGNPGAVSLVLTERVPVVPVGIVGAYRALPVYRRFPRPHKIVVRFGAPIMPEELEAAGNRKDRLAHATRLIMARIAELSGCRTREEELREAAAGDGGHRS